MNDLEILVFQMGTDCFGIRVDQVRSMTSAKPAEAACASMAAVLGDRYRQREIGSHRAFILDSSGRYFEVPDMMGIFKIPSKDIHPLPDLIMQNLTKQVLWGAAQCSFGPLRDRVIFLLDLQTEDLVS